MITEIAIQRFKSYQNATLPLSPLTLLIGANASGKSNAIEAVRFLSWLARGRRLEEILSAVQEADQQIRGSVDNLAYAGENHFGLGCQTDDDEWNRLELEIAVDAEGIRIVEESVQDSKNKVPLYAVADPASDYSHEIQVQYNNFARGGRKPRISCTDQQAVFTQLETPARFGSARSQKIIPRVTGRYRNLLSQILFLDPSPRRMRQYSFRVERTLKGDGSNLSSVLYDLCEKRGEKDEVLQFIRALPEQDIRDLTFLQTPRNEVMLRLTETFAHEDRNWDAPLLSDGTLRVLAVAAALLSAPEGSLVIIEEIDNGVHPSRAGSLLESIQQVANRRNLHVLLSTHNPALLDALPGSAVPDVVCCYRDPEAGDSRLLRLEDLREYPELVAQGPLGQLMTQGILDRFLKDRRSPEEKRARALAWLEGLKVPVSMS